MNILKGLTIFTKICIFFQSTTALEEGNLTGAVLAAKTAIRSSGLWLFL